MDDAEIGQAIRRARVARRLSQVAFAEKVGASRETVRRWEAGLVHIEYGRLNEIAGALGIRFELAVQDKDAPTPSSPEHEEALAIASRVIPALDPATARRIGLMLRGLESAE